MTRGARFTCWLAPRLVRLRVLRYYTVIDRIDKVRFDPPLGIMADITAQHREVVLLGRRVRLEEARAEKPRQTPTIPLFHWRFERRGATQ